MWQQIKISALLPYAAGKNFVGNFGFEMAGYLTFLTLLSLFPYLVLMVSAAGLVGQGEAGNHLITLLLEHLPADAVATIRPRIVEITSGTPQNILTFSILGALWTSSSAVEAMRGILNRAYCVRKPPAYVSRRLTSLAQIFLLTCLIITLTLLFVFVPIAIRSFAHFTGFVIPLELDHFLKNYFKPIAAVVLFGLIATFYYVLPNIKQSLLAVVPGALLVVVLWVAGAFLVTFYLSAFSQMTLIYGSLSGFIATLIFFYVMHVIFIYGAEFNHALMVMLGKRIVERAAPRDASL
ncbi:MAG: YihY/virulence factor BrkB family protein [Alphaproteobacteria bacterium]|nr:YihY/virulence factor BrkB family protein [Alphaproteobacteria bacterium]